MKPEDLVKVWDAPDHSKLTPKQISIRLPILAAARIEALCELFPSKTKTQIISDLIATALDQVVDSLPSKKGRFIGPDFSDMAPGDDLNQYIDHGSQGQQANGIFEDIGIRGQFLRLTKTHLRRLEKEANLDETIYCPDPVIFEDS